MGNWRKSNGDKISKQTLDARIAKAKKEYSEGFDYIYCERHERNDCKHIARSHIVSVNTCQNSGRSELAYCQNNLEHLCQTAHQEIESWSHQKREAWYNARKQGIKYDDFIIDWENEQ
jgi:hypothetical protein